MLQSDATDINICKVMVDHNHLKNSHPIKLEVTPQDSLNKYGRTGQLAWKTHTHFEIISKMIWLDHGIRKLVQHEPVEECQEWLG